MGVRVVGTADGTADGTAAGCALGVAVGDVDGTAVGLNDGAAVGCVEGAPVGDDVGAGGADGHRVPTVLGDVGGAVDVLLQPQFGPVQPRAHCNEEIGVIGFSGCMGHTSRIVRGWMRPGG